MNDIYPFRKPIFKDIQNIFGLILIFILFLITYSILDTNSSPSEVFELIGNYSIIFLILIAFYWPIESDNTKFFLFLMIFIAFIQRFFLLEVFPITSTDYHRNLMFGNAFFEGVDVYITSGIDILSLIEGGSLNLIIPYTNSWDTHAYDYPSIAIWFFWLIIQLGHLFPEINPFVIGKILLNVFDFGTAYFLYKIGKNHLNWSEINSIRGSILFLFNPFSVFEVGIEGQFESMTLFFFITGLYFYLKVGSSYGNNYGRKSVSDISNVYLGTFFFTLSVLTKYYSLVCLPGILWLLKDDIKLVLRQLASMVVFGFYLSLPFIINGPYILNFLNFQADRNANPLSEILPNVLGYHLEISFWIYALCIGLMVLSFLGRNKEVFSLSLMSLILTVFLFKNNSLFPWYFIWLMNSFPLMNYKDNFTHSLFWFILVFIYLTVWLSSLPLITLSVIIIGIGFIATNKLNPVNL